VFKGVLLESAILILQENTDRQQIRIKIRDDGTVENLTIALTHYISSENFGRDIGNVFNIMVAIASIQALRKLETRVLNFRKSPM
jgi:hypothetical protein